MRKIWKEPTVQFVLAGVLAFGVHAAWGRKAHDASSAERIVVTREFVAGLAEEQEERTGTAPDEATRALLVGQFAREESLVREAIALGLHRGDLIIRRRLVQKMEFLAEQAAVTAPPSEDQVAAYFDAHKADFALAPQVSFTQVFVARGDDAQASLRKAQRLAAQLPASPTAGTLGDPLGAGADELGTSSAALARRYGASFASALAALPRGRWAGPLESALGWHWIWITGEAAARVPRLDEVRAQVRADLTQATRSQAREAFLDQVMARYRVEVEGTPAARLAQAEVR